MFDLLYETFRKASESSLQMPQDMFKHWTQQWLSAPPNAAGASAEWARTFQKRWTEMAIETLNKHRESLDSTYRAGIQLIEQTFRFSDAKSSEDYRRIVDELWHRLLEMAKEQSEAQFRDFQTWAAKSIEFQKATS
jgi:hypothetical protein